MSMSYQDYSDLCASAGDRVGEKRPRLYHADRALVGNEDVPRVGVTDPVIMEAGVMFQRCGGGRRIIRKRIGGN